MGVGCIERVVGVTSPRRPSIRVEVVSSWSHTVGFQLREQDVWLWPIASLYHNINRVRLGKSLTDFISYKNTMKGTGGLKKIAARFLNSLEFINQMARSSCRWLSDVIVVMF